MRYIFRNRMGRAALQKGGALIYVLIAVALMAALTGTLVGGGGSQSSRTQNAFKLANELSSQIRVIRSAIQDCVLRFPQGDQADIAQANYNDPYPLNPTSNEFSTPAGNDNVEHLRCPGTSGAAGNDDYRQIFTGSGEFSGFLPSAPDLMSDWTYFNGDATIQGLQLDGVFIQINSTRSDPFIAEAMEKVDNLMASCEVDYLVGTGSNSCPNNTQCLRYWIIRGPNTAATGGPNACP